MVSYRITKYNPAKRNEQGHYLDDSEWTAISDIGNPDYNNLTYEEYEKIESAYVHAIQSIMRDHNFDFLIVDSLEFYNKKEDFNNFECSGRLKNISIDFEVELEKLDNGLKLNLLEIDKIIRLILRETVWMLLVNDHFEVRFGYDYYMYVTSETIKTSTIKQIENSGLFVED